MPDQGEHYPCPCCGYLVFDEGPGSYDICPICFWEDDAVQLRFVDLAGGANHLSLRESQRTYAALGACESRLVGQVRQPTDADQRDPLWRPLDPTREAGEDTAAYPTSGKTYFAAVISTDPEDPTTLYYWRR